MIRPILAAVLSRRPVVLLGLLAFMAAGIFAFLKLNVEAYPNPAPVILEITAQAPGLSAEEMERYYTRPMEVGLATTPGVDNIRSTSFYGLSFVRVTFKYDTDYYFALTQVANNLQANVNLPNGVQAQIQASSLVGEILRYQVKGPPGMGVTELRTLQDWVIERRLLTVPGVVQVVTWGGTTKEYHVEPDPRLLESRGITLAQLISAIGNANLNVGGRAVSLGDQSVNIRGLGLVENVQDIGNVVITQQNGLPVQVKDVARIVEGTVPRLGEAGRDGERDVVTGVVIMNRTLHTKDVIGRVEDAVKKINSDHSLPPGVTLAPYYDRSVLVGVTTHTVLHNLIFGCVLVFLIQWIFLGDLRSAVIVSVNIPFALFFSIMILVATGESANLLSLGAVDFGIIVDAAVILVENIFRNFQRRTPERAMMLRAMAQAAHGASLSPKQGWTARLRMIYLSATQVDSSVLFSTCITIAAFTPLFTMQGVEGQIFGPMARTYGYALAGALIATFTITPVLASYLLPAKIQEKETVFVRAIEHVYRPALHWALANARITVAFGCIALVGGGFLATRLGSEFLPALEEGNLWIRASMPPTISLDAGSAQVDRMRALIKEYPEVVTIVSQHGRPDDGSDAAGFNNVELFAPLRPYEQWRLGMNKQRMVRELQAKFENEFPGVGFNFSQYIQDNVQEGLSGVKGANSVKIIGPDLATLEKLADEVMETMAKIDGVADLGIFHVLGQPNMNIRIDRAKAARYGLNTGDVNATIQAALGGTSATTVLEGDRQFGLTVRFPERYRGNMDAVKALRIGYTTSGGGTAYIPLSDVATISVDTGATYIYRESNERYIPIKFTARGRDLGGTVSEVQKTVAAKIKLPEGYRIVYAGEFENLQQAKSRMAIAIPLAVALIVVLLYALFSSFAYSMLTLAAVPFTVLGGILALWLTGQVLSVSAIIGFISLLGVSVMDGILILGTFKDLKNAGRDDLQAITEAYESRMRPLLMTALSACIGLFPAAMSHSIGSEVQRPLATVVVGGMLIGPLFLLLVMPAIRLVVLRRLKPSKRRIGLGGKRAA
ncbi:CusA/CzcA family heavy metal efflux RND transporter [Xylophilus rhododendri]|uniref:CusA/CzcA family heavy metal efflux RND transporter n=1 Tax=Xylophilus rhododendri TaxID=2697032 RepID=A0A857J8H1_9BURK|nr:CusA/CzcA family heavy metal efflux RND transporter [Xylophilus rhododendri]QHI99513.1 CusA/CzcA family heavy metal efflux RND transporter [Xylophilus rhododendri]